MSDDRRHTLTRGQFDALASGLGGPDAIEVLRKSQLTHWMMTAASVIESLPQDRIAAFVPLLKEAKDASPSEFERIATYPSSLARMDLALEELLPLGDEESVSNNVARLGEMVLALAVGTGIEFSFEIEMTDSKLVIPSYGEVTFERSSPFSITVSGAGGVAVVDDGRGRRTIDPEHPGGSWRPLYVVKLHDDWLPLALTLDDTDYFPQYDEPKWPQRQRLSDEEVEHWKHYLTQAWQLITERHSEFAPSIAEWLRCIVPLGPGSVRASAANRHSFGAISFSRPETARWLAFGILNSFQTAKLDALDRLLPLHHATHDEFRFYSPSTQVPRSLREVFNDYYGHFAGASFWEGQRAFAETEALRNEAQVELARWRDRAASVRSTLEASGDATEWGEKVLAGSAATLQKISLGSAVSPYARHIARVIETDFRIAWRLRNLSPDPAAIRALIDLWLSGRPCPSILIRRFVKENRLPLQRFLARRELMMENLARYSQEEILPPLRLVPEATAADRAFAEGRALDAIELYEAELRDDLSDPDPWTGIAICCATQSAQFGVRAPLIQLPLRVMSSHVEVAAALHMELMLEQGEFADPIGLAQWLSPLQDGSDVDFELAKSPSKHG